MPIIPTAQFPPPGSWEEFEQICADLFSLEWGDKNLVRHGRAGQRQNGVDIYGRANGGIGGVQCKGKRIWPPKKLTAAEVTAEVKKARKFAPALTEFTIVTTADDDAKLQSHARQITKRHEKKKLFSVHVYGWQELERRIKSYDQIIQKYYGFLGFAAVARKVDALPARAADLIVERLQGGKLPPLAQAAAKKFPASIDSLQPALAEALRRDFAHRYDQALQRTFFPELQKIDLFRELAREAEESSLAAYAPDLSRSILLRAARSTALRKDIPEAKRLLQLALALQGNEEETGALARIAAAEGDSNRAIRLLRDKTDPDSRSILLNILAQEKGLQTALDWFAEQKLSTADLTANGIWALCQIYLKRRDIGEVLKTLTDLPEQNLVESPYFYFLRGAIGFASIFSKPDQAFVLDGFPLDLFHLPVAMPEEQREPVLDAAIRDLKQFLALSAELQLPHARRITESAIIWAELVHPERKARAIAKLRQEMQDPSRAVKRVAFALAFDPEFDPAALDQFLQRRSAMGDLDGEDLQAAFVLTLNKNEPRGVVNFISGHRAQLEESMGKSGVLALEIRSLALAKDATVAKRVLDENTAVFDAATIARLNAEIAKAEGADPVAEHMRVYAAVKSVDSLRELLRALIHANDYRGVAKFAEELYGQTNAPHDIVTAARATLNAGGEDNFIRLAELHPIIVQSDADLALHYAWNLVRQGRLKEAKTVAAEARKRTPAARDLNLEITLAIETGAWDQLAEPLTASLADADKLDGLALIRAANLARASGEGPMSDLIEAAVRKAPNDPAVLIGAYSVVLEEGLEDSKPQAQSWFKRALDLSGPDGPVKRFELKELLTQQTHWNEHTRRVSDLVTRGDLPLVFAAPGLRTTVVDVVLRNLVRNSALADPRKRVALTMFSGRRLPTPIGPAKCLAIDVSALMVMGWLGLLPKVFDAFAEIVLPSAALSELFEGRARIREHQKSRLQHAVQVHDAIARGKLNVFRASEADRDTLSDEIGAELAGLLRASELDKGFVLRPAPIHALGLTDLRDAEMSAFLPRLADMHALLGVLSDRGAIERGVEETARNYFAVQDQGWRSSTRPEIDKPLYIDGLALVYLQTANLLDVVLQTFSHVFVHAGTADEALALIEHNHHVTEVQNTIEAIRLAIHNAYAAGKVTFGPRAISREADAGRPDSSTIHLLSDFKRAEILIIDDRALNQQSFGADTHKHGARVATTLDLLEELAVRYVISSSERDLFRHRLRIAGAVLVPVDADEIRAAAERNKLVESPEFRAIRESVALARAARVPIFPTEMPWLIALTDAIKRAIYKIWNEEVDMARAASLSDAIFALRPHAEEWVSQWQIQPPPDWAQNVNRVLIATLSIPIEIADKDKVAAYNKWFDLRVLDPVRRAAPDTYRAVVDYIRRFIITVTNDDRQLDELLERLKERGNAKT